MKILATPFHKTAGFMLSRRQCVLVLSAVFLLMQSFLYYRFGVKIMHDSIRYINFADSLYRGVWPDGYVNWYIGYCVIILLAKATGAGYGFIVLLQVIVALIALYCLFDLVYELSGSTGNAFIISLLFATSYQVQLWNVYILTESFFISGSLITTYLLYKCRDNWRWLILIFVLLIFTVLQRPNGFILIGSLVLYFVAFTWQSNKILSRILTGIIVLFAVIGLVFLNSNIAAFITFFKTSYLAGEIICGYQGLTLAPSKFLVFNENDQTLRVVYELVSSDILYFIRLALSKLFFLFADVRPYYSIAHNLYIVVFLGIVYLMFFKNIGSFIKRQPALFVFLGSFIFLNACLVMITYTDWDGRFLAPLLAPILIIAGGARKEECIVKASMGEA